MRHCCAGFCCSLAFADAAVGIDNATIARTAVLFRITSVLPLFGIDDLLIARGLGAQLNDAPAAAARALPNAYTGY